MFRAAAPQCTTLHHPATHFAPDSFCSQPQHAAPHDNTMQHTMRRTATHCDTLQHTATHCNTLQHTATHCNTLQHTTLHHSAPHLAPCSVWSLEGNKSPSRNALQHTATYCNTLAHTATPCCKLQHTARPCNRPATGLQQACNRRGVTRALAWVSKKKIKYPPATHFNPMQPTATYCDTLRHPATHCNTLQHTATYCSTRPCNTAQPLPLLAS